MQRPDQRARLRSFVFVCVIVLSMIGSIPLFGTVRAQDDTPVGDWSVAFARTDIPVDIASSFSYVGRWRLSIHADGNYEAERLDVSGTLVEGQWSVDGDRITFTDEDGILSCSNAAASPILTDDIAAGTYTWQRSDKTLTLTRVDDGCPGRVILLSTYAFSTFVACTTAPLSIAALQGTPVAESGPSETTFQASPIADGAVGHIDFATEIDMLLDQLTACWANREPERWLPLLSHEFQQSLVQSDPGFVETLTIAMTSPITWERSGDITLDAPNQISAIVKSTVGTEVDYQRFVFVFEDGQWRWNG